MSSCFASGSLSRTVIIKEVTPGTTPTISAGDTQVVPFVDNGMVLTRTVLEDPSITGNRQKNYLRLGNKTVGGDLQVSLSALNYDVLFESVFAKTFASNTLKVGNEIISFTLETGDIDKDLYRVWKGVQVSTFSVDMNIDAIASATFSCIGRSQDEDTSSIDTAPSSTGVSEAFYHADGSVLIDSVDVGIITAINFNINSNISQNFALGSDTAVCQTSDMVGVEGSLTAYFKDFVLMNKFINEETSTIKVNLSDGTNTYAFTIPKAKWTGSEMSVSEGTLSVSMPFTGLFDTALATTIQLVKS